MSFVPNRRSFPHTRVPHLLNLVRACPKGDPAPKCGSDGTQYLYSDEQLIVVPDAYPKSTVHFLVLPRDPQLESLNSLTRAHHVQLLRRMISVAEIVTKSLQEKKEELKALRYISGFHAIPSLPMLHMHHLSMDLESDRLKNKKHYNSFSTYFFLPAEQVVQDMEANGHVTLNQRVEELEAMEKGPMKCLWCGMPLSNIPMMKSHVPSCGKNASRIPSFVVSKKKEKESQSRAGDEKDCE